MANNFNNAKVAVGTAATALYTTPGTQKAIVHALYLTNGNASGTVYVDVAVHNPGTGVSYPVARKVPVAANAVPVVLSKPLTLLAAERLDVTGDAAGAVAFASIVESAAGTGLFAIAYKGNYAAGSYKLLDAVSDGGYLWFCVAEHTGGAVLDQSKWARAIDSAAFTAQAQAAAANAQAAAASGVRAATVSGSANAIVLAASPAVVAYAAPLVLAFVVGADNSGAVTVNVDGLGAVALTAADGTALGAGALKAGRLYLISYQGSGFRIAGEVQAARLDQAQTFTRAQRGAYVTLADAATVAPDFGLGNRFKLTLGGNRAMATPTSLAAGQGGVLKLVQDATGSRTLSWSSTWKWKGGAAPTLSTAANAVDLIGYEVEDDGATITAWLGVKGRA